MLTLITGSSKRSVIIQSVILWIALFINALRFVYTAEPFTIADFAYISNIAISSLRKLRFWKVYKIRY